MKECRRNLKTTLDIASEAIDHLEIFLSQWHVIWNTVRLDYIWESESSQYSFSIFNDICYSLVLYTLNYKMTEQYPSFFLWQYSISIFTWLHAFCPCFSIIFNSFYQLLPKAIVVASLDWVSCQSHSLLQPFN